MNGLIKFASFACVVIFTQSAYAEQAKDGADRVLMNANIYTVNQENPWVQAVAIDDGKFVYVGDSVGAQTYIGSNTIQSNMNGRFVMPGIIDGHTHPGMVGVETFDVQMDGASKSELLAAIKEYASNNPGDSWIKACCWSNQEMIRPGNYGPQKEDLDALKLNRPVWVNSAFWHSYWLNSEGLRTLGVSAETPDPAPGVAVFVKNDEGEPTGWIKEGAGWQFAAKHFPADPKILQEGIDDALTTLSQLGVTTVYDAGNFEFSDEVFSYLSELESAGKLPVRYDATYTVYLPERRHIAVQEMKRYREAYSGDRLKFRTIKLFMDGITPALSSGMSAPFMGDPEEMGGTTLGVDELRDWLIELHKERFDLHVHAIGDLAVTRVLDAVEAAKATVGEKFYPRITMAHLQTIKPSDWPRFNELGVTANFTAWWRGLPDPSLSLLPAAHYQHPFPADKLIKAGTNVTFSSDDWSIDAFSPYLGMHVGHTLQFPGLSKGDSVEAPVYLMLEQLIRGYTLNAAIPFRMENKFGSIAQGKVADLLVLNNNPFEVSPDDLHVIKPDIVMMEGKVIHGAFEN